MDKLTITTLDGKEHEIKKLTGRAWRVLSEFTETAPQITDADFLERHAAFIAQFYSDVTAEDILDLPIEEIFPASLAVRNYINNQIGAKLAKIEKNSEADKAQ